MSIKTRMQRLAMVDMDPGVVFDRAQFDEIRAAIAAIPANTDAWRGDWKDRYFLHHADEGENQAIIEAACVTVETVLVNDWVIVKAAEAVDWPGGPQAMVRALLDYGYLDAKAEDIAEMHGWDAED